ncbi:MAG: hypothetical protein MZV63_56435, partial [Marinilabiliales bacterium]|nr:hypothetical protein [Marinilabiliales bacterium]
SYVLLRLTPKTPTTFFSTYAWVADMEWRVAYVTVDASGGSDGPAGRPADRHGAAGGAAGGDGREPRGGGGVRGGAGARGDCAGTRSTARGPVDAGGAGGGAAADRPAAAHR